MDGEIRTGAPTEARWTWLRAARCWGLAILGPVTSGDAVTVTRKDGTTESVVVGPVVWSGSTRDGRPSALAHKATAPAVAADVPAVPAEIPATPHADRARARKAGRSARRYRATTAPRGRCEDAPCCGCCGDVGGWSF